MKPPQIADIHNPTCRKKKENGGEDQHDDLGEVCASQEALVNWVPAVGQPAGHLRKVVPASHYVRVTNSHLTGHNVDANRGDTHTLAKVISVVSRTCLQKNVAIENR